MRSVSVGWIVVALVLAAAAPGSADEAESPRHLIYLHGRIVQDTQSARPQDPQFGFYELDQILDAFRERGFVVSGEIRSKQASVRDSADLVVEQVRGLIESGVSADHVTVVGASVGAAIALVTAARLRNPDVRYVLLGTCLSGSIRVYGGEGKRPNGRLLVIREKSDRVVGSCPPWKDDPAFADLVVREMVVDTGQGHGYLYRPLPEWLDPAVAWAEGRSIDPPAVAPGEPEP